MAYAEPYRNPTEPPMYDPSRGARTAGALAGLCTGLFAL